ncbi:MAG: type II secretion system F family protein [Candidatus Micrarchaeia archaeon]
MCAKPIQNKKDSAPAPFVSTPYRANKNEPKMELQNFFSSIAKRFPALGKELEIAEMSITPAKFVANNITSSLLVTILLEIVIVWAMLSQQVGVLSIVAISLVSFLLLFMISFNTAMYAPKVRIQRRGREIDQEIVFCGRHLLIELSSGVTLFDAMLGVSKEYGEVSKEFNKIVEKITLGVPATVAMHEVASNSPSSYFRRMMLQIANSLTSGSDVATSLETALDQISKEQVIKLKEYGQKLNPLVMFYMLFGVIIPSLGVAFMIIVFSVLGAGFESIGLSLMLATLGFVIIMQVFFLSVAENSRPNFDL